MAAYYDLDWDQVRDAKKFGDRVNYMTLKNGSNKLRIVSPPVGIAEHWQTVDGKAKSYICPVDDCPLCKSGKEPTAKFAAYVIDRSDSGDDEVMGDDGINLKIIKITPTLANQLKQLGKDPDWGSVTGYDVVISKSGEGKQTKYTVIPQKHTKLTKEEEKAVKKAKNLKEVLTATEKSVLQTLVDNKIKKGE